MQHDAQERRLDLDASVVVDVPHLPKFVHKEIDASSRRADDFGERLVHALTLDVPSLIVLPIDYSIDVAISDELGVETVAT